MNFKVVNLINTILHTKPRYLPIHTPCNDTKFIWDKQTDVITDLPLIFALDMAGQWQSL